MSRSPERPQWHFDLTAALDEAEMLLLLLEAYDGFADEACRLRQRIRALESELTLLNRDILGENRIIPRR